MIQGSISKITPKFLLGVTVPVSLGIVSLFSTVAQALTFVPSRAALEANDSLDWSVLGSGIPFPGFPPSFPTVSNLFSTSSTNGLSIDVAIPAGEFFRIDQDENFPPPLGPDFPGAFENGEALLFTGLNNPGPLTLSFDIPVFSVGMQIQSDPSINAVSAPGGGSFYTSLIEAFDSFNNSLGTFELEGISKRDTGAGVLFLGVSDEEGDIAKVVLNSQEEGTGIPTNVPFAINTVSIRRVGVSEPNAIGNLSLVLGLGILSTLRKKTQD